jgi:hypothetical protein
MFFTIKSNRCEEVCSGCRLQSFKVERSEIELLPGPVEKIHLVFVPDWRLRRPASFVRQYAYLADFLDLQAYRKKVAVFPDFAHNPQSFAVEEHHGVKVGLDCTSQCSKGIALDCVVVYVF